LVPATVAWTVAGVHIAIGIAAAAALALWVATRRWPLARTPADAAMAAFALACVLSTLTSATPAASAMTLRKLLLLPLAHLVVLACDGHRERARTMLRVFVAAIACVALVAAARFLIAEHAVDTRLRSTGHYMTFAGLQLMAACVAAGAATARIGRRRWLYAGVTAVLLTALVLSFTRSAWLGALAAAGVILWRRSRRALVAVPLVVGALLVVAPAAYRERAWSAFDPQHPTNADRLRLWRAGVAIWRDHPWTGVGLVDLAPYYERYRTTAEGRVHGHLHDNALQILATTGALGLLAFLWLMVAYGRIAGARAGPGTEPELAGLLDGVWGAFWGFQVMGLFEWNFGDVEVTIGLVFLIGAALAGRARPVRAGAGGAGNGVSP
jgi:O-antigen ligase